MSLVRWDDKYLVGQEVIDRDHKMLFSMVNDFHDAFIEAGKRRDLITLLTKLVNYAEAHFQREEAIMAAQGYAACAEHHDLHTALYEAIYQFNQRLESDPTPLDRPMIAFLKDWLTNHILQEDLKFGEFLRQKTPPPAENKVE